MTIYFFFFDVVVQKSPNGAFGMYTAPGQILCVTQAVALFKFLMEGVNQSF